MLFLCQYLLNFQGAQALIQVRSLSNIAKRKVLLLREGIKKDQKLLDDFYKEGEGLAKSKLDLKQLLIEKEQLNIKLNDVRTELESNEQETLEQEEEIKYIKEHSSIFKKLLILLGIGKIGMGDVIIICRHHIQCL